MYSLDHVYMVTSDIFHKGLVMLMISDAMTLMWRHPNENNHRMQAFLTMEWENFIIIYSL